MTTGTGLWHGTARETRDRQRRRRLLNAALELYGTVGYRASTVQGVCRLAKVSTRSFYEIYADHEHLLESLCHDLNDEVLAAIAERAEAPAPDAFAATRRLVSAVLGPMLADDRKARVLQVEAVGVSEALEQERRRNFRRLGAAVDRAFEGFAAAGLIASAPSGLASLIIVGGITEALVQRVQTEFSVRVPTSVFIDEVAEVVVRMTCPQ